MTLTADMSPASTQSVADARAVSRATGGPPPQVLRIGCSSPPALDALEVDERVFFDDGRIGGAVTAVRPGEADVRISLAAPEGTKLRSEKGINFPDTDLDLPALGSDDEPILDFVVGRADLVGLSFAQRPGDIEALEDRLHRRGGDHLGIVIKVETARGFAELPAMLLCAMRREHVGVMVARGDLAVECGFERLAELQEEILWICDAGHVPLIWATQVLDQMARTGQPSRAEISDAAMSGRAECVMLNKGPHIVEAVTALDDILRRMSLHQRKKVALLRRLSSWSPSVV